MRLARDAGIVFTPEDRAVLNASTLGEAAAYFHEHFDIGGSVQDVLDTIDTYLLEFYQTNAEANPGALEFVRQARAAGIPMCVLSSSPQRFLQAGLGRAGFLDLIDTVLSAEELPAKKRDPLLYPEVCAMIGCDLQNAWLFDDSCYAIETAHTAGLHTVGVFSADACGTHEELGAYADLVIDSFDELPFDAFMAWATKKDDA